MRSKADLQAAIRQHRRAVLVVNTRSRRGARMYRDAGRQLEAAGFGLLGSFAASRPASWRPASRPRWTWRPTC